MKKNLYLLTVVTIIGGNMPLVTAIFFFSWRVYVFSKPWNLGLIKENNKEEIKKRVYQKHPEVKTDGVVLTIEVLNHNYDTLFGNYWATGSFINGSHRIKTNVKLIFNTQDNINQQIKTILGDEKIQMLLRDITQFANNTKFQLKNIFPYVDNNNKLLWIFNIIEHLKTYLRDFVYVIDLIKVQLQLKKIYNWVLNLENNIINLKAKIKNLQTKLNSLNNYDRHTGFITCNNVGFLTAGVFGITAGFSLVFTPLTTIIATISAIGTGLAGSVASLCGIAEQRKL